MIAPAENRLTQTASSVKQFNNSKKQLFADSGNPAYGLQWWTHIRAMDYSPLRRHLLAQMIEDSGPNGYCSRAQAGLAKKCKCTTRAVATAYKVFKADGIIFVVAGEYRKHGRGRLPSKVYVNMEHVRFRDCPPRKYPSARAASCSAPTPLDVLHERRSDKYLSASVDIPTVVVSQKQPTDQTSNPPIEPAAVQAFAAGARDRKVQIRPEDVPFLLALLIRANADRVHWLRWCHRYESPHKYRNPRALLQHLVRKYTVEHAPHCVDQCLRC